jgi:hypothetical protein
MPFLALLKLITTLATIGHDVTAYLPVVKDLIDIGHPIDAAIPAVHQATVDALTAVSDPAKEFIARLGA